MESARLLTSFDWVAVVVKAFAAILIFAAMASLLGALLQALARREPEIALLRAMGASRLRIASLVFGESLLLVLVGAVLAGGVLAAGAWAMTAFVLPGIGIDATDGILLWLAGLTVALLLAFVATIPVLWRSFSIDVAAQMSSSVPQLYSADTDLAYVLNQDAVRVAEDICKVLVEAKVLPSNHSRQWSYKVDRRPLDRNPLKLAHVNAS